jgi:imidazole glycerol phosphate synthase subunit HisF
MDTDGTKNGYDLALTKAMTDAINIPLIASGGAGNPEHLYQAIFKGADATLKILAVVKADAYGHGAIEVARKIKNEIAILKI